MTDADPARAEAGVRASPIAKGRTARPVARSITVTAGPTRAALPDGTAKTRRCGRGTT